MKFWRFSVIRKAFSTRGFKRWIDVTTSYFIIHKLWSVLFLCTINEAFRVNILCFKYTLCISFIMLNLWQDSQSHNIAEMIKFCYFHKWQVRRKYLKSIIGSTKVLQEKKKLQIISIVMNSSSDFQKFSPGPFDLEPVNFDFRCQEWFEVLIEYVFSEWAQPRLRSRDHWAACFS